MRPGGPGAETGGMNPQLRRPTLRSARRALAGAAALAVCVGASANTTNGLAWVPVGRPGQLQYYVDAQTVRTQGALVHYRLYGRGIREESRQTSSEAEVGVDCAGLRRVEYVTTTRWDGGVRTATAHQLEPVAATSAQAQEIGTACLIAGVRSPQVAVAPEQADAVRQVMGEAGARRMGTGFAVSRDTLVTNHHVVQSCSDIRVVREGTAFPARLVASDAQSDLAALAVGGPPMQPLEVAPPVQDLGEAITVLGFPLARLLGGELRVTTGIVSALSGVAGDALTMQISAPVQAGNSGGPVLDESGAVAGVVAKKLDLRLGAENVSFAIRTQPLRAFLAASGVRYVPAAARQAALRTTAQVVRKAAPSVFMVQCT
jgi:hypothetical protein